MRDKTPQQRDRNRLESWRDVAYLIFVRSPASSLRRQIALVTFSSLLGFASIAQPALAAIEPTPSIEAGTPADAQLVVLMPSDTNSSIEHQAMATIRAHLRASELDVDIISFAKGSKHASYLSDRQSTTAERVHSQLKRAKEICSKRRADAVMWVYSPEPTQLDLYLFEQASDQLYERHLTFEQNKTALAFEEAANVLSSIAETITFGLPITDMHKLDAQTLANDAQADVREILASESLEPVIRPAAQTAKTKLSITHPSPDRKPEVWNRLWLSSAVVAQPVTRRPSFDPGLGLSVSWSPRHWLSLSTGYQFHRTIETSSELQPATDWDRRPIREDKVDRFGNRIEFDQLPQPIQSRIEEQQRFRSRQVFMATRRHPVYFQPTLHWNFHRYLALDGSLRATIEHTSTRPQAEVARNFIATERRNYFLLGPHLGLRVRPTSTLNIRLNAGFDVLLNHTAPWIVGANARIPVVIRAYSPRRIRPTVGIEFQFGVLPRERKPRG